MLFVSLVRRAMPILACGLLAPAVFAAVPISPPPDQPPLFARRPLADAAPATLDPALAPLGRIEAAARASQWALDRLEDLTDQIGPRLTGSVGAAAAVAQVSAALRDAGLTVHLEPVRVGHWERGTELGELVDYAGRPAGVTQKVVLTALGGSAATPAEGLTAPVIIVHDFDALAALGERVRGSIVLFDVPFPLALVEHGSAGEAYGQTIGYRVAGPARAAKLGAVAALVRSLGSADFRLPHTGVTVFPADQAAIPAAAVTAEDAQLISRLERRGAPVRLHLTLTPRQLPEVDSANVIAEIPGSDPGAGVVLVSGHLDSWDLAQGAIDDGTGVAAAMGALQVIHSLGLHPRRTLRFVAWMNEENGSRGAQDYAKRHADELRQHVAAIESDAGAGYVQGFMTNATPAAEALLRPLRDALQPFGHGVLLQTARELGSDLEAIEKAGTPVFEPLVDTRHYFDFHHTPADTFDKVIPADLQAQVALLAELAWYLANTSEPLPRLAIKVP
jgi:Zn-dependent M28 family amino/carboxypeptidase